MWTIDRTRQAKEEELRDLFCRVVLLEEQQKELHQIKQRQDKRHALPGWPCDARSITTGATMGPDGSLVAEDASGSSGKNFGPRS